MTIKKAGIFYDLGCSIQLVAGAGRGEAEEPERSDGNRLYGSIADKKAVGSKSITAFYDNKKSRNLLRPRLLFLFGSGCKNNANSTSVFRENAGVLLSTTYK